MDARTRDSAALAVLSLVAVAIAAAAVFRRVSTPLEAASFVTGALCVWLTVKENVWNFPIGLVNVATFSVVFYQSRLFADTGLQVVYFVLGVIGWHLWLYGGENRTELHVGRATARELTILLIVVVAGTAILTKTLSHVGGSTTFWDAITTMISLVSQWLLNSKRLENWIGWIIADAIYVPLYAYKELYLTSLLYAVFLAMAIIGYRAWKAAWLERRDVQQSTPLIVA